MSEPKWPGGNQYVRNSVVFGVQLIVLFVVSATGVQAARGWFVQQGLLQPDPAHLQSSARVLWPHLPMFLPAKVQAPTAAVLRPQSSETLLAQSQQALLKSGPPSSQRMRLARLTPLARQQVYTRHGATRQGVPRQRYLAPKPQKMPARTHVPEIRRILKRDYGRAQTPTYEQSMQWVRQTLKDYQTR